MKFLLIALTSLVLFAPIQAANSGDIVDFVVGDPNLTTLTAAVVRAGLVDALRGLHDGTLFAPNNSAFGRVPSDIANALFTNDEFLPHLVDLLLVHVLSDEVVASDIPEGRSRATALNHERLQLHVDLGNRNLALVGDNGSLFPLGLCEGDCDSDSDCDDHLECFERNGLTPVRGCLGTGVASKDYCTFPGNTHLTHKGDNGHPSSAFPLGLCEGDCDDDHDCLPGLHCFERHAFEPVPGCQGRGDHGKDYCALIPTKHLEVVAENRLAFPLGHCEGDCDGDHECASGLHCFERNNNEDVPGCLGTPAAHKDYCALEGSSHLTIQGDNGHPVHAFPLGVCEGDCDSKHECADGLLCFQRHGTEHVPGCEGSGSRGKDYCYKAPTIEVDAECNGHPSPTVVDADNQVSNGVVHIIDGVLFPSWVCNTILSRVASHHDLSTLLELLVIAHLDDALDQPLDELTLLAPTNDAFARLSSSTLHFLKSDAGRHDLTEILLYHVLGGIFTIGELSDGQSILTLQGGFVHVDLHPLRFNHADVVKQDILANNGVVQKINRVLDPADG